MVLDVIKPLLALCVNAHALVLAELRRIRMIPGDKWPFPKGFRTRVAAAYIAHIFSRFPRAEDYGNAWLKSHGVESCAIARVILVYMKMIDDWLTEDCLEGFINFTTTELICRKALALEEAFERCSEIDDWLQPKEGTPNRKN